MKDRYQLKEPKTGTILLVSKDVIDWLDMHDIDMIDGVKRYYVNNISYDYLGVLIETLDTIDVEVVYKEYENNSFSKEYSFGELTAHWLQQGQITLKTAMRFLSYKPEHKQW